MEFFESFQGDILLLLAALMIDALVGDPRPVWRLVPHPVMLFGFTISAFDRLFNRPAWPDSARFLAGCLSLLIVLNIWTAVGFFLTLLPETSHMSAIVETILVVLLVAQRDLYDHVHRVAIALRDEGLAAGRAAVSMIVGRDPEQLDEAGVSRAAIESLAENFSDGVVAPVFWYLIGGLPGLFFYKALNTADSMIGHRSEKYLWFGKAAARLDDIANWIPARLTALLVGAAALILPGGQASGAIRAAFRDASGHKSVNAGWPEAAMAGALGIRLAGPRTYDGKKVDDVWMGDGRTELTHGDISHALSLYIVSILLMWLVLALAPLSGLL